jgi:hypothetical protein
MRVSWEHVGDNNLSTLRDWKSHVSKELTSWSRVRFEKLIVPQLLKKFPAFYGTQKGPYTEPDASSPYLPTLLS